MYATWGLIRVRPFHTFDVKLSAMHIDMTYLTLYAFLKVRAHVKMVHEVDLSAEVLVVKVALC